MLALGLQSRREIARTRIRVRTAMATQARERPLPGAAGRRTGTGSPTPGRTRTRSMRPGGGGAPAGTGPSTCRSSLDVRPATGRTQRRADHPGLERRRHPVPVRRRPGTQPAPYRCGVDAAHGGGDPGQPALHRAAGAEPAAHRLRPGRPGQHRARAPAGPTMEPARGLGHLPPSRASGAGQRGRLHRRPGRHRAARPSGAGPHRRYLPAGLLACGTCGRRLESAWSNGKPAYRCRHGHTSAARPEPGRPKNTYVREDQILPHLAAVAILLARGNQANGDGTRQLTTPTAVKYPRIGDIHPASNPKNGPRSLAIREVFASCVATWRVRRRREGGPQRMITAARRSRVPDGARADMVTLCRQSSGSRARVAA